jgi:geranylgeranyl reductase family protein
MTSHDADSTADASAGTETWDIVVVGAGTSGCYAAATAANAGLDVVVLERKTESEAGHIACGDALKGADSFPEAIPKGQIQPAFTNTGVDHGRFEIPSHDTVLEIPVPGELAVIDRLEYGRRLIEGAERAGAAFVYETVVQDVVQDDDGCVRGVRGKRKGEVVEHRGAVTIDGAGALSILQDKADLDEATFDTNVSYSQFCSAYREIVEVQEEPEWSDAIVFKPTEELGYLWYFPRGGTEVNAGLGFQMNKEPMELVDVLRRDLENRPEFEGATVRDKLGAALPTRRPYDSATAPGFIAAGDSAAHVNPTTGGGIPGAAKSAHWAAQRAVEAITEGDVGEANLWEYNQEVLTGFGKRFAAVDLYNIWGGAHDVDELVEVVSAMPGQQLADAMSKGEASMDLGLKLKTVLRTFGHWSTLYELYQVREKAGELKDHYEEYPSSPDGFEAWRSRRDSILDKVYAISGAEPKY